MNQKQIMQNRNFGKKSQLNQSQAKLRKHYNASEKFPYQIPDNYSRNDLCFQIMTLKPSHPNPRRRGKN